MQLYYAPGACSLAPHIVAREAGLALQLVKVDLATKSTEQGENYLAINPKGAVPALRLDDGRILTEAAVVIQYLADLEPGAGLLPAAGTFERYRALEWLNFIATEVHKGFGPLWKSEATSDMREIAIADLSVRFGHLDRRLAEHDHLLGHGFSALDAYAFAVLSWAGLMKIDLAPWPHVSAYLQRIAARPQVREALAAEGLLQAEAETP